MERLPEEVRVGMKVYDSEGHNIGRIDDLKFPENAIAPNVEVAEVDHVVDDRDETILTAVAEAFGHEDIPEPLRSQLLRDGYVHLDSSGLFASDRYILPEQISGLTPDGIKLNVTKDALIKRPH